MMEVDFDELRLNVVNSYIELVDLLHSCKNFEDFSVEIKDKDVEKLGTTLDELRYHLVFLCGIEDEKAGIKNILDELLFDEEGNSNLLVFNTDFDEEGGDGDE